MAECLDVLSPSARKQDQPMMPAKPPHGRKLGLLVTSLTMARLGRNTHQALSVVRDGLEQLLIESGFFQEAPFSWVTVSIRYGLKNDKAPRYEEINKRFGDLPLAIEVDTHELIDATLETSAVRLKVAVLKALIHAGRKYERPVEQLECELIKLGGST